MAKFIEIKQSDGTKTTVNVDHIACIIPWQNTYMQLSIPKKDVTESFFIKQSYETFIERFNEVVGVGR